MRTIEDPPPVPARQWDGDTGTFWAAHADRFDRGVAGYQAALLTAAAGADGDAVLDVGCGNGRTSIDLARRVEGGSVLGIDLSAAMLAVARARAAAEGVPNVRFEQGDAQRHPFPPAAFDVAVSRNGTMFFDDPPAAFAAIAAAVRPGGRLVLQTWQPFARNEWLAGPLTLLGSGPPGPDAPGPLGLSDPGRITALLTGSGFTAVTLTGLTAPMWFGADPADALGFLTGVHAGRLGELGERDRDAAVDALRADLERHHDEHGVRYGSAAWLVTARRA